MNWKTRSGKSWGRFGMKFKNTPFGKMPDSWELSTISEVTELVTDYVANGSFASLAENVTYRDKEDVAVLIRLVDYNNDFKGNFVFIDEHAYEFLCKSKLHGGEIIISNVGANVGTVFRCPKLPYKMSLAPNAIMVKFKDNNDFYYFWLRSHAGQHMLRSIVTGSAQPKFNKTNFRDLLVPVPPKVQQDKIVSILQPLEDKIELNNAINENLQQQLKLLYDYWFTQFDFPDENGNPYRSSGGQMVWNDTLKRDIPAGWKVESIIENSLSCPIKPGVQPFEEKDYLATAAVNGTSISSGTLISYESRESRANMQPTTSSVWFAKMKNSIKHLYLNEQMKPIIENTILSTGFCGLQCTEQSFEYIATFVEQSYFETMKDILAHGATQESVNTDDLLGLTLVIPVDTVLEAFHKMTAPLYKQIGQNICENQQLSKMRDWLLPMLMNGQATVAD